MMKRTLRKLVTMGFAALCAFAGVMADDGSDPGVLSPGEWTTDLTVNGRKVWSKYSVPKGEGWGCRYDSKQNLLTLNISSGGSYTIGGELTGRSMDKKGKVTKINFGRVAIAQSCTVTLDSFSATACTGFSTVEIADGKEVTFNLKGENRLVQTSEEWSETQYAEAPQWFGIYLPLKSSLTIRGGESDTLSVDGICAAKSGSLRQSGRVVVEGGQFSADAIYAREFVCRGGRVVGDVYTFGLQMTGGSVTADYMWCFGEIRGGVIKVSSTFTVGGSDYTYWWKWDDRPASCSLAMYGGTLDVAEFRVTNHLGQDDEEVFRLHGGIVSSGSVVCTNEDVLKSYSLTYSFWTGRYAYPWIVIRGGQFDVLYMEDCQGCSLSLEGGKFSSHWGGILRRYRQSGGLAIFDETIAIAYQFVVMGGTMVNFNDIYFADNVGAHQSRVEGGSAWWPPYGNADGITCKSVIFVEGLPAWEKVAVEDPEGGGPLKDIYADSEGRIYLRAEAREEPYGFTVNGYAYTAAVHGKTTKAVKGGAVAYTVTYSTTQGSLYDEKNKVWTDSVTFEYAYGAKPTVLGAAELQMTCRGKRLEYWENLQEGQEKTLPGDRLAPVSRNIELRASWTEDVVVDEAGEFDLTFVYSDSTGKHQQTMRQTVGEKIVVPANPSWPGYRFNGWFTREEGGQLVSTGTLADESVKTIYAQYSQLGTYFFARNDNFENAIDIGDKSGVIANPPVDYSSLQSAGEPFSKSSVIDITGGTLWYRWTAPMTGVATFTVDRHGTATDLAVGVYTGGAINALNTVAEAMFTSDDVRISFDCDAGRRYYVCVGCDGTFISADLLWNAVSKEELSLKTWTMNRYGCADIMDLGIEVPTAALKAVKAEGLPKGLKLVQDKAKTAWYVEGVATEPLDYEKKFAMIRFQFKTKGVDDNVQKLALEVVPDTHIEHQTPLGDFSMSASGMFDAPVDKNWTVSGTPSGVSYDKKSSNPGFTGKLSKLGAFTLTAKEPVTSAVPGTSTKFNNVYTAELLVTPAGDYDDTFTVVKGATMEPQDITSAFDWAANTKSKSAGQPSGMKYAAGVFSGKVTAKAGLYPVTVTSADKQAQANYLVRVQDPAAPSVGAYFGTKVMALLKKIVAGDATAEKNGQYTFMRGSSVSISLMTTMGATVKAAGLPAGLKVEQDKTKKSWSITGVPTKVGDYLATLTVTKDGVSSAVTYLFEIVENAFAGDYRGVIASSPAADAAPRAGTIIVNIAEGGATKVSVCEDGKSALTYSAKSFGYVDSGDYAFVEFELKPSSADKNLGYDVRKGRVMITKPDAEVDDYRFLEGTVKLTDGTAVGEVEGNFVAPSAANVLGSGIDRESRFFTVSDGGFDVPIATVRHEIKSGQKIPTADIAVTLYDGTTAKIAKQPIVRDAAKPGADEAQRACYSLAPFAVKAKDGQVFVFHSFKFKGYNLLDQLEGAVTFVGADGELVTVDEAGADEHSIAAMELNDYFGNVYKSKTTLMTFDYGREGFETFALDHVNGGTKRDCLVLDLNGEEIAKIPAKNKIGVDGAFSYKFTTKDKIYTYQLDLVYAQDIRYSPIDGTPYVKEFGRLVGMVTKTWKEDDETKTLHGVVDFVALDPVE